MPRLKKQKSIRPAGTAALLGQLLMALMSCKSPSSPEEDLKAYIHVYNTCGAAVDIFMDEGLKAEMKKTCELDFPVIGQNVAFVVPRIMIHF